MEGEYLDKIKKRDEARKKEGLDNPDISLSTMGLADCAIPFATKYIKVYAHYMLRSNGTGNFNENNDGYVGKTNHIPGVTGFTRAQEVVDWANTKMAENYQMYLPSGNNTPVLPKRVQYVLSGVLFHRSDTWYEQSKIFSDPNFNIDATYGVNRGSAINIYFVNDSSSSAPAMKN
jgi:hypothetical protein